MKIEEVEEVIKILPIKIQSDRVIELLLMAY